jgi:hypothetical protein
MSKVVVLTLRSTAWGRERYTTLPADGDPEVLLRDAHAQLRQERPIIVWQSEGAARNQAASGELVILNPATILSISIEGVKP